MKTEIVEANQLSFVIPVLDEQDTLENLALQIMDVVSKIDKKYKAEIIFIDDGSKDKSWSILKQLVDH